MSFTRKMLKAMGIEDEKIDQIIDAHLEVVDAIKEDRDNYKIEADKVPGLEQQIKDAENAVTGDESWKVKYDALKEDFDTYKNDITTKETRTAKETAFTSLLKEIGISEKRIDSVLKISDIDAVELDNDGKIKGVEELSESLKTEWADFIVVEGAQGADVGTPPSNTGVSSFADMTLTEKMMYANAHPDAPEVTEWLK